MVTSLTTMPGCVFSKPGITTLSSVFTSPPPALYASQNVTVVVRALFVRAPAVAAMPASAAATPRNTMSRPTRMSCSLLADERERTRPRAERAGGGTAYSGDHLHPAGLSQKPGANRVVRLPLVMRREGGP